MALHLLDALPALTFAIDVNTYEVLYANPVTIRLFGEIIGQKCWSVLQSNQTGPCPFCNNHEIIGNDPAPSMPIRSRLRNTITKRWYEMTDFPIHLDDGRLAKVCIAIDITDQLASESSRCPDSAPSAPAPSDPESMVVMCASCHKIRSHTGRWHFPANFLKEEMGVMVSHGMCGSCARQFYPDIEFDKDDPRSKE